MTTRTIDNLLNKASPRLVLRSDLHGIAEVEQTCFSSPWTSEDFAKCLDRKHCNGLVIEVDNKIIAFLIYEVRRRSIQLINLGVRPDVRRKGLGSKLIKKLISYMVDSDCSKLRVEMRETNLDAQLFLNSLGFKATAVVRGHFTDTGEDMYQMSFDLSSVPVNS